MVTPEHGLGAAVPRELRRRLEERHWQLCAKLPIQLAVTIPLPPLSLKQMLELTVGGQLLSAWPSREDVPLLAGETFLANVTFEPAGANLGVRISGFQARNPTQQAGSNTAVTGDRAETGPVREDATDLDHTLKDILIPVSLCFGTKTMPLQQILDLTSGDAIVLERTVNAQVSVLAGRRVVAHGGLIAVKGFYGVRLARLSELSKRLEESQGFGS
jgi:flagellar motor switch/type III secretory pathway protein FliN